MDTGQTKTVPVVTTPKKGRVAPNHRRKWVIGATCVATLVTVASIIVYGFTSDDRSATTKELEHRGFTNVEQREVDATQRDYWYVDYGDCRLRIDQKSAEAGDGLVLKEVSTRGSASNLEVDEPSTAKLDQLEALEYCRNGTS